MLNKIQADDDIAKTEALLVAADLLPSQNIRTKCPVCQADEKAFSVSRTIDNQVLWHCYRASCQASGGILDKNSAVHILEPAKKIDEKPKKELIPYTGDRLPLDNEDFQYFENLFGLILDPESPGVAKDGYGNYLLDIFDSRGHARGVVVRKPWHQPVEYPKAKTFMHTDGPSVSWYRGAYPDVVVLVEDQISAMKAAQVELDALALLGTHMDIRTVREIWSRHPLEVLIALDADATDQALKLAMKWGPCFDKVRVVPLEKDLKDSDIDDIRWILGVD